MRWHRKLTKAVTRVVHTTTHTAKKVVHTTTNTVAKAADGTAKTANKIMHETTNVVNHVGDELEKGGKKLEKTTKEVIKAPERAVNKLTRAIVKEKINKVFEKQMHEAVDNLKKDLEQRKVQDKALIDQAIKDAINDATEKYINLTSKKVLDEIEIHFTEALSLATAAVHNCRLGYKEFVEEILTFEFGDEAFIRFMEEHPLRLALQDLWAHQRAEALEVLIPYFEKNMNSNNLSTENINDYLCLKDYVSKNTGNKTEKEVEDKYFSNMIRIISTDAKTGKIKASSNGIIVNISDNNNLKSTQDLVDQCVSSSTANVLAQINSSGDITNLIGEENPTSVVSDSLTDTLDDELQQAVTFYQDRYFDEALVILKHIISIDPDYANAYKLFGDCYYHSGQIKLALDSYNHAIELDPNDPFTFLARAYAFNKFGDYEHCSEDLEKYIQMAGDLSPLSQFFLAWFKQENQLEQATSFYKNRNYDAAISKAKEIINLDTGCSKAYKLCGDCYYESGQIRLALESYNRAIEVDPNDDTFLARAVAFNKLADDEDNLEDIERYNQLDVNLSPQTQIFIEWFKQENQLKRAKALYQNRSYDAAITVAKEIIRSNPDCSIAYSLCGDSYYDSGQTQLAVVSYNRAIELYPNNAYTFFHRSFAFAKLRDYGSCLEDIEKFIQLKGHCTQKTRDRYEEIKQKQMDLLKNKLEQAMSLYKNQNYDDALSKAKEIIDSDPNCLIAYKICGRCYYESGQTQLALESYNRVIKLDPNDANIFLDRAYAFEKLGDDRSCAEDIDKYMQLKLNNSGATTNRTDKVESESSSRFTLK